MATLVLQPNSQGHAGGTAAVKGILPFLASAERAQLLRAAPGGVVVAYGKAAKDKTKWDRVSHGDTVLFYHRWVYFAQGRVALKTRNAKLCRHLWGPDGQYEGRMHDRILLYTVPEPVHIGARDLNVAIGYERGYVLRPFQVVEVDDEARLSRLLRKGKSDAAKVGKASLETNPEDGLDEALEGRQYLVQHLKRERSRSLRDAKRKDVLRETGKLQCEACGFDARKKYEWLGLDFGEVHHIQPLSFRNKKRKTTLDDLAILCASCHRMIHRTSPIMSIKAFRDALN